MQKSKGDRINETNIAIFERRSFALENIPNDIHEQELRDAIEYYCDGEIIDIYIPFSSKVQRQASRAFIIMSSAEDTGYLIRKFNNYFYNGKNITAWLVTQERRY